jgi:Ca-activated chloride channel family protein
MRFASICLSALAIVASAVAASAQPPTPPALYRARTDLVALQVAVTDGTHRYVSGLGAENFAVYEEGVRQEIALFASSAAPLDVLLLMDTSASMDTRLDTARLAAIELLNTLRPGDRAGLVLFHTSAELAHPLSEDREGVTVAVERASAGGATALYEAVYLALDLLARERRTETAVRRQALVVLSDGADNRSRIPFDQALDAARAGGVTIFTIVPGGPLPGAQFGSALRWGPDALLRFEMRQLAEDTGGRAFVVPEQTQLTAVYQQIAGELREQYWLAYARTSAQPGFRRVSVRVTAPPGLVARTRTGYDGGRRPVR